MFATSRPLSRAEPHEDLLTLKDVFCYKRTALKRKGFKKKGGRTTMMTGQPILDQKNGWWWKSRRVHRPPWGRK